MKSTFETDAYKKIPSTSLFLYGFDEKLPAEILLPLFEKYFLDAGVTIHGWSAFNHDLNIKKSATHKNLLKCLESGVLRNLTTLYGHHLMDRKDKQSDLFSISYDFSYDTPNCQIVTTQGSRDIRLARVKSFLLDMLNYITPTYGYSAELPLGYAPGYFALGMFAKSEFGDLEATAWQRAMYAKDFDRGKMRHVFALNVLSSSHLDNKIGHQRFADWASEPGHGTLEKLKEGIWLWTVPRDIRARCASLLEFNGLLTVPPSMGQELFG